MEIIKKILLISFCFMIFAVRTKMARDIEREVSLKSDKQVQELNQYATKGNFVK